MIAALHFLFRGHWPEVAFLDTERICLICDVGRPTGSSIRTWLPANGSSPKTVGLMGAGASVLS